MQINGGRMISYLELDKSQYSAGMRAALAEAKAFSAEGATLGTRFQGAMNILGNFGRLATTAITVPVTAAWSASTKAAIEFESAFAGVRKTVDASEKEYAALNKGLLEMSRIVPRSADALAGIMEAGGQLGVPKAQLEGFTRVIADLAVATNLTEEAGASMLAQYANVTGMDIGDIDRLGSVIVDLGNNTATTEADIVSMAQRLSGAASILKLTDAQTMGLSATMSSLGINAEAGGSAMSRVLQRMMQSVRAGGEELEVYAKTAGVTGEAFAKMFDGDPLKATIAFIDGLARINDAGGDVYDVLEALGLGDLRITDSLLRMTGAQGQLETNIRRASKAWDENTALTREAEQRYNTTESKIQLAKNAIREAGITLGGTFLPIVADVATGVGNLAKDFSDLDENSRNSIITGLGIAAAAGPASLLLKGVIGLLSGPGGVIAGLVLGGTVLATLTAGINNTSLKSLSQEFGTIKLSADEIKRIVEQGFGAPRIDFDKVRGAREEAEKAKESFVTLQEQLAKDVYLVSMGVKSMTPEEAEASVSGLLSSAQAYLDKEENAARMTVTAYFGENTDQANAMLGDIDTAMSPLKAKLKEKGEELGKLLVDSISSGDYSAERQKAIAKIQGELAQITASAALLQNQNERDVAIAKAQQTGLSLDSLMATQETINAQREKWLADYETEQDYIKEGIEGAEEEIRQAGAGGGGAAIEGANEAAAATDVTVGASLVAPLGTLPSEFAAHGSNAVTALVNSLNSGVPRAFAAGQGLGKAAERGAKSGLKIASPSRVMVDIANNAVSSLANQMKLGLPKVHKASETLSLGMVQPLVKPTNAYTDAVLAGRTYTPLSTFDFNSAVQAGITGSKAGSANRKPVTTTRTGGGSGAGPAYTEPAQVVDTYMQQRAELDARLAAYTAQNEKLLQMAGPWRAYYDETTIEKQMRQVEERYKGLINAASDEQKQHQQEQMREELDALRTTYDLQKQLALDWIESRSSALSAAFAAKQDAARQDDYEQSVAELEKRIRQTRSARERRELTEELARMRRDEGLRLEQLALNQTLSGMGALKSAVSAGVIGLGDLLGDKSLPAGAYGAGLKHVQGITADQLQSMLDTMSTGTKAAGNTYQIDLSGAVIRDDSDIDRIVNLFEERQRSMLRNLQ